MPSTRFAVEAPFQPAASLASAADIGQIKTSKGDVSIERGGATLPGTVGTRLEAADVLRTGADGSAGVTMSDNSLLSVGPNSVLALDAYRFDTTTHRASSTRRSRRARSPSSRARSRSSRPTR